VIVILVESGLRVKVVSFGHVEGAVLLLFGPESDGLLSEVALSLGQELSQLVVR